MMFNAEQAAIWGLGALYTIAGIGLFYLFAKLLEDGTGFPVWASILCTAVVIAAAVCGGLGVFG